MTALLAIFGTKAVASLGAIAFVMICVGLGLLGTALSATRNTTCTPDLLDQDVPLAAGAKVYQGGMVCRNAAGYLVAGSNTAGYQLAGVCKGDLANGTSIVDNTNGGLAALTARVARAGVYLFASSGLTRADVGKPLYLSDDQTVTLTRTNVRAGHLAAFESATEAWVDIASATFSDRQSDDIQAYSVKTATTIVVNTMVCVDATGYLIPAANTSGLKLVGHAVEGVVNAGASGAAVCLVQRNGIHNYTAVGLGVTDLKKPVWVSNATTVTTTPGHVFAGILANYVSATVAPVDIEPAVQRSSTPAPGRIFTMSFGLATLATTPGTVVDNDLELPIAFEVLSAFMTLQTAPGGTDTATFTLAQGASTFTLTATGAEAAAENKAINVSYLADTNIDATFVRTGAAAAGASVKVICRELC